MKLGNAFNLRGKAKCMTMIVLSMIMLVSFIPLPAARAEAVNVLESISLHSDQSLRNRVIAGNTVKLTFKAKEEINNVKVAIQGEEATVTSPDNLNWTAELLLNAGGTTGTVEFTIDYNLQDGSAGQLINTTTDNSQLFIADETDQINVVGITDLIDSTTNRAAALTLTNVMNLFDGSASTFSDFRLGGSSGAGAFITFDFKQDNKAVLSNVEILARQDTYYTRIKGALVQGSNDNSGWTTLATAMVSTEDWQSLTVSSPTPYRYIRIYNSGSWFGNMAEVRLHGNVTDGNSAPVLSPIVPVNIKLGETVSFAVYASDADGDAVSYSGVNLPEGAALDAGTGQFVWTPEETGSYPLTFQATDSKGLAVIAQTTITVGEDNTNEVVINETVTNGFTHPGVGLTKEILENMRAQVLAQKEPWYSNYQAMRTSSYASASTASSNASSSDPTKPSSAAFNSQGFNSRFIADGLKAYTQTIMYFVTGDESYRANAMRIIRIWEQMDPAQYTYFTDAHIHTGVPLNRMVTAAEILRYTSAETEALKWTEKDTTDFTNNLITPVIETFQHDNSHFMNQHTYPLMGAISGYIFTDNTERYNEAVEWFTVNKTAEDQGINGSIEQLFRLVDTNALTGEKLDTPVVQHVEMGRDQAHGAGDITNASIISRLLLAQDTKVDPVEGTVSNKPEAVNSYEFLDHRILAAADEYWQYMLGFDTPWVPVASSIDENGNIKSTYNVISDSYRGRMIANCWDLFYYYTYEENINVKDIAPHFFDAFTKRPPAVFYYKAARTLAWDGVDGGGDAWIYIPKEAEAEGDQYLPKEQTDSALVEIEDRYTAFDNNSVTKQEGNVSYVEVKATSQGSVIAPLNFAYADRTSKRLIGLKIRTDGAAEVELSKEMNSKPIHTLTLPDTGGQWKYVVYDMGISEVSYSQIDDVYSILYMRVKGADTKVDIDKFNVKAGEQLSPPSFKAGSTDLNITAYVGAPITYDFSASDANSGDVVTYEIADRPAGSSYSGSTGNFSWQPAEAGISTMIVVADDGTSISTKKVTITVVEDREAAVEASIAPYDVNALYVSASLENYTKSYDDIVKQIETATDDVFYQKLLILQSAVANLELMTPLLPDGSLNYIGRVTSTFGNYTDSLIDDDTNSYVAYGLAADLYHTVDFGSMFKVSADAFDIQGRRSFPERIAGIAIFGSNDGENWTRLTAGATTLTEDRQKLAVKDEYKNSRFRFFKMQMIEPQSTMLEVSEFRIFGERHETINKMESVSLSSEQSFKDRVIPGNTVKLTFKSKEELSSVKVTIQGQEVPVESVDNINWTAELLLSSSVTTGTVKFSIHYKLSDGVDGEEIVFTTDSSKLFIVDETDLITVIGATDLVDPTGNRTAATTLTNVNNLFDGNAGTFSDFRLGTNGAGGFITFDFKEDHKAVLSRVEILARQDTYYSRIKGAIIQGSNDNVAWTTLTAAATSTLDWQSFMISNTTPFRYIRIFNAGTWYGNMAEVRIHGKVGDANAAPVFSAIPPVSIRLGESVTFAVYAADADGDAVRYSGVNLPAGAMLDAESGQFVWTPDEAGVYTLIFQATDSKGLAVTAQTTVTVQETETTPIPDNHAPVFSAMVPLSITLGETVTLAVYAADADGDSVRYSGVDLPAEATLDAESGQFVWTPGEAGVYTLTFRATDSMGLAVTVQTTLAVTFTETIYNEGSHISAPIETSAKEITAENGNLIVNTKPDAQGTLRVELLEQDFTQAIAQQTQGNIMVTIPANNDLLKVSVLFPANLIREGLMNGTLRTITFDSGLARITLPADVLESAVQGEVGKLNLSVSVVDPSLLETGVSKKIGSHPVLDFSLQADGKAVSNFAGKQAVTVTVDYSLQPGEAAGQMIAYYIDDESGLHAVRNTRYDAAAQQVIFAPQHFSKYTVLFADTNFKDVDTVSWAKEAVLYLAAREIVKGTGEDEFAPESQVTRVEFVKLLVTALGFETEQAESVFTDTKEGAWYNSYTAAAKKAGIIKGREDGSFGVSEPIRREDMAVMISRALKALNISLENVSDSTSFTDQADISGYAREAVQQLSDSGIVNGKNNGNFTPVQYATRAEAAVMIYRLLQSIQ